MTIKKGNYSVEVGDDSGENALVFIGAFGQGGHVHITAVGTACDGGWASGDFTVPKTRVHAGDFYDWVTDTLDTWGVRLTNKKRAVNAICRHFYGRTIKDGL